MSTAGTTGPWAGVRALAGASCESGVWVLLFLVPLPVYGAGPARRRGDCSWSGKRGL